VPLKSGLEDIKGHQNKSPKMAPFRLYIQLPISLPL